jgi:hypothetical protein
MLMSCPVAGRHLVASGWELVTGKAKAGLQGWYFQLHVLISKERGVTGVVY